MSPRSIAFFDSNDDGIGVDFRSDPELGLPAGSWRHGDLAAPVYPSPLRGDGYDIADYTAGTLVRDDP